MKRHWKRYRFVVASQYHEIPVETLPLPPRLRRRGLRGVRYLKDLHGMTRGHSIWLTVGVGRKSIEQLEKALSAFCGSNGFRMVPEDEWTGTRDSTKE
jgi:hypothetical protein